LELILKEDSQGYYANTGPTTQNRTTFSLA